MRKISILLICLLHLVTLLNASKRIEIRMPNVSTHMEDAYMASYIKLEDDDERYITSIEPLTNAHVAHHMFVYGCEEPAEFKSVWEGANVCHGSKMLLFAWGLNAKALVLPEGWF